VPTATPMQCGVLEAPAPGLACRVADGMREAGVLIGIDGSAANVLKIRPPMPIQEAHADLLVDALDAQLERL
jgi:4-aminobutyrate aminotransferase-like enzyme